MENPKAAYWSVMPADVRYDDQISANAKVIYSEITALANKQGYCWAGNDYFMEQFRFSDRTVTRLISELEKYGYIIRRVIKDNEGKVTQRRLYLRESAPCGLPPDKIDGTRQNCQYPPDKIGGENNISNNKKENKKEKAGASPPLLTDSELSELCIAWIHRISPESWDSGIKNGLYKALLRFYAPRDGQKQTPKRSKAGLDALCSKLLRISQGDPALMLDCLDTATTSGWKSVFPPDGHRPRPPAVPESIGGDYDEF